MNDISKPYTDMSPENRRNFEDGWDRIFGEKNKLKKQLHEINSQRHKIINGIQAKEGRTKSREWQLEILRRKREKIVRQLEKLK